jgi:tetratricopeptide (TPR) repeat protein
LPEGIAVLMAISGDAIVISPSQAAIGKALAAQRGGKSVLDDAEYSRAVASITPDSSLAVFGHAGRCLELAKNYMSKHDLEEVKPFGHLLDKTVGGVLLEQGDNNLRLAARVTGIPDVSGVVAQLIREQRGGGGRREMARQAMKRGDAKAALAAIDEEIAKQADEPRGDLLLQKFEILATKPSETGAAVEVGEQLLQAWAEDANELNSLAWKLLTEGKYEGRFSDLARRMSERSNTLTGHKNWMYLDTLAHARFALGDIDAAIELERKALENCKDNRRGEAEKALKRFEEARNKQVASETN